jgi:excisionase family DNA binding protein
VTAPHIAKPLTAAEAAQRMGVCVRTLKSIAESELPFSRPGLRDRRYQPADVDAYIARRTQGRKVTTNAIGLAERPDQILARLRAMGIASAAPLPTT